jgi:hypothetical protein
MILALGSFATILILIAKDGGLNFGTILGMMSLCVIICYMIAVTKDKKR